MLNWFEKLIFPQLADVQEWLAKLKKASIEKKAEKKLKKVQEADDKEKSEIARLFNDRYCYVHQYVKDSPRLEGTAMFNILPKGGNRWMCPECNKIHAPETCSSWSGLQYPSCCKTGWGDRLFCGIKVFPDDSDETS